MNTYQRTHLLQSHAPPISIQPQLSRFTPLQLLDDGRSREGFLIRLTNSYISPSFIKAHKRSSRKCSDKNGFFERSLIKIQQNDPDVLSLAIDWRPLEDHEITRFIKALAVNSTLFELKIIFQHSYLTKSETCQLVEALKLNSTLTRLSLKANRVKDAAATRLSQFLQFNTTLLSLDLSLTGLTENGISQLCAALAVNTTLIHLNLRRNEINDGATTQLCKALTVNSVLTVLDLRFCKINESGAFRLNEALAGNPSLTRLEIQESSITIPTSLFSNQI